MRESVLDGKVDTAFVDVGDDDLGRPANPGHGSYEQANSAGAEHKNFCLWWKLCTACGMYGYAERLQYRSQIERHVCW